MVKEGVVNVNKPEGMTSHACVQAVRRLTGIKRIGHTGTLDPMATGVLPICIGSAARIMEYLDLDFKTYRCEITFGIVTDTQDIWGTVVSDRREELRIKQRSGTGIAEAAVRDAFSRFDGIIEQTPPKYSAIKVNGRKLYEYARAGEDVKIKKRKVFIKSLSIRDIDLTRLTASFDVTCSKGTYIRAICDDVGAALGCGAAMSRLVRLASGVFTIERAIPLDKLKELKERQLESLILDPDYPLVHFGKAVINGEKALQFQNGGKIRMDEVVIEAEPEFKYDDPPFEIRDEYKRAYNIYEKSDDARRFVGVAFYNPANDRLVADKVFLRRHDK